VPTGPRSPAAARTSRFRWQDPRLALGLGVIGLCCLLGSRILSSAEDTVSVWAARSDLQQGQPVGGADLVRREVRFDDQGDADRYLSAGTELPADATVDRAIGSGELLPRSALAGAASGPVTEVPVAVRAEAVPASVHVGSTVDVWVTPTPALAGSAGSRGTASGSAGPGSAGEGAAAPVGRSTLVFHDVAVVSAPRGGTSLGPTGTRQVTVGIAGTDNGRLSRSMAALAGGDVTLTSRR
jgi:hypothetical protein